jgi:hypothetical protein
MRFGRITSLLLIGLLLYLELVAAEPARAAPPRFASVILTDDKDRKVEKTVFAPDTPVIYAIFVLADVPANTTLRCVWIAEKTQVAPPDHKIDEFKIQVGGRITQGNCSFSKPTAGWPVGEYRLEMSLGERLAHTARFRVQTR